MHTKGVVFGVFDHFHQGHYYFLQEASKRCEELLVVVTLDEIVQLLKNKTPHHTYEERVQAILSFNKNIITLPSDKNLGAWTVFKTHKPDITILGHDQHAIAHELEKINQPFIFLDAHFPEHFKTSILQNKNRNKE